MEFRFPYNPQTGQPGTAATPWTNGDPAAGIQGSIPPAEALNDPMREICHVIDHFLGDNTFGSAQNVNDLQQLRKAIQAAIAEAAPDLSGFVQTAGDIMSGVLRIAYENPVIELEDAASDAVARLQIFNGVSRLVAQELGRYWVEGLGATPLAEFKYRSTTGLHDIHHAGIIQTAVVQDRQAAGVNGQAIVVNTWQKMPLNTIVKNDITGASVVNNELRLNEPGTYELFGKTVAAGVNRETQIRLRNTVNDSLIEPGFVQNAADGADSGGASPEVFGEVTVTAAGQMRVAVDRYATATQGARLWGRAAAPGIQQVYGQLIARRIS